MIINNNQLDKALLTVIERVRRDAPQWEMYFLVYYQLGTRAREPLRRNLWTFADKNTIILMPQKNNAPRLFLRREIPRNFLEHLKHPDFLEITPSYSQLNYLFKQAFPYNNLYVGKKSSTLHLFRHNYARALKWQGYTDEEIKIKMGEHQQSSADEYIYSEITTTKN